MSELHYNKEYFENFQKSLGEFGGTANLFKFEKYLEQTDTVLDFGCGGAYLLRNLNVDKKIGIEINETARNEAEKLGGVEVYSSCEFIEDNSIDKIISNHALEHTFRPLDEIIKLRDKLKDGGVCIFNLPHETIFGDNNKRVEWDPNDINMHLYTWNCMTLGNLFKQAGYTVLEVKSYQHQWPPNFREIVEIQGWEKFHELAQEHAKKMNNYQILIVAKK